MSYFRHRNKRSPLTTLITKNCDTYNRVSCLIPQQPVQICKFNSGVKYRIYIKIERYSDAILNPIINNKFKPKYVIYSTNQYKRFKPRSIIDIPLYHNVYLLFQLDIIPVFPLQLRLTHIYRINSIDDPVLPDNKWRFKNSSKWYCCDPPSGDTLFWAGDTTAHKSGEYKLRTVKN